MKRFFQRYLYIPDAHHDFFFVRVGDTFTTLAIGGNLPSRVKHTLIKGHVLVFYQHVNRNYY